MGPTECRSAPDGRGETTEITEDTEKTAYRAHWHFSVISVSSMVFLRNGQTRSEIIRKQYSMAGAVNLKESRTTRREGPTQELLAKLGPNVPRTDVAPHSPKPGPHNDQDNPAAAEDYDLKTRVINSSRATSVIVVPAADGQGGTTEITEDTEKTTYRAHRHFFVISVSSVVFLRNGLDGYFRLAAHLKLFDSLAPFRRTAYCGPRARWCGEGGQQ